jgi:hypothetical protein
MLPQKSAELREEFHRMMDDISAVQETLEKRPAELFPKKTQEEIDKFRFATLGEMWSAIQPGQTSGLQIFAFCRIPV